MHSVIASIYTSFHSLGIFGAFLSMMIENLGIPLPIAIGYIIGQEIVNENVKNYPMVLFVLTLGHVVGAIISYWVGVYWDGFITKKLVRFDKIQRADKKLKVWFDQFGNITVFLARFVGYVRPWSSLVSGIARVPFLAFIFWTILGSLIFNIFCLYFSNILMTIWGRYENLHFIISAILFLLFFGFIVLSLIKLMISFKAKAWEKNA